MRSSQRVVLGHEFVGEVADYGPGTRRKIAVGRRWWRCRSLGVATSARDRPLAAAPGGYAERVVVEESLMFALPNGLSPKLAVLTEPLAVGWHAVRRAEVKKGDEAS